MPEWFLILNFVYAFSLLAFGGMILDKFQKA